MAITLSIERGVTFVYSRSFVDSDTPPSTFNFYGSEVALVIYLNGVRVVKSTAEGDGSMRFRLPTPGWPATRADDPRQGSVSCEFSAEETAALPVGVGQFELRRLIDGSTETLSDGLVSVTDKIQTTGIGTSA